MMWTRRIGVAAFAVLVLAAAAAVGWTAARSGVGGVGSASEQSVAMSSSAVVGGAPLAEDLAKSAPPAGGSVDSGAATPAAQIGARQVVRTGSLDVRVTAIDRALASARAAAADVGAQVESLTFDAGSGSPLPLAQTDSAMPKGATLVLRVPADKLGALGTKLRGIGTITAESFGEQDVTQQAIDLDARLKNLRAEEARLRSFLGKATKVSDMLAVEQELSRVRGEIESMQAQKDYLDHQVALATLTVRMFEPAPVVSPAGTDWGFAEAITAGVRGAAAVTQAAITVAIAAFPLLAIAAVVWMLALWRRRRRERTLPEATA